MTILECCWASLVTGSLTLIWIAMKLCGSLRDICHQLEWLRDELDATDHTIGIVAMDVKRIGSRMQSTDQQSSNCDRPACKQSSARQSIQTEVFTTY